MPKSVEAATTSIAWEQIGKEVSVDKMHIKRAGIVKRADKECKESSLMQSTRLCELSYAHKVGERREVEWEDSWEFEGNFSLK